MIPSSAYFLQLIAAVNVIPDKFSVPSLIDQNHLFDVDANVTSNKFLEIFRSFQPLERERERDTPNPKAIVFALYYGPRKIIIQTLL